jgi:hypothetical protein
MKSNHSDDQGFILVAALLLLLLLSVLSVGMIFMANSEISSHSSDLSGTQTYYVAEAGMEKMMVDMANLYTSNLAPDATAIHANVDATSKRPAFPGYTFSTYQVSFPGGTIPTATLVPIKSGANAGLLAEKLSMNLNTTARKISGEEVSMSRRIEVALIPVFQFGIFSDTDLAFHAGSSMYFGGRIHSNGNLFLQAADTFKLVFGNKVSAFREVILDTLPNGEALSGSGYSSGQVFISTIANCCTTSGTGTGCVQAKSASPNMGSVIGSTFGGSGGSLNTNWPTYSSTNFNGQLINYKTGAKALTLPFVGGGLAPIEIIRRPPVGEDTSSSVGRSRLYNQAQIRVLLDDDNANFPGGAQGGDVQLENVGTNSTGVFLFDGTTTFFAEGNKNKGVTSGTNNNWITGETTYTTTAPVETYWPLVGGWLRVEYRDGTGNFNNVTQEWLRHGFARSLQSGSSSTAYLTAVHSDAILIFQMLADFNGDGAISSTAPENPSKLLRYNWFPINMYDPREGITRTTMDPSVKGSGKLTLGGIMNVVELNVQNLQKWLNGTMTNSSGTNVESSTQNGYVLYYSDHRGCIASPVTTTIIGEYGFEDVINNNQTYGTTNGVLDRGEDVNGNGVLDDYGTTKLGDGFIAAARGSKTSQDNPYLFANLIPNQGGSPAPSTYLTTVMNRVTGPRHVLRLVNGGRGNLPRKADGTGGFTVASENPIYVQGDYNANSTDFPAGTPPAPYANAAIIADAVTILSSGYTDKSTILSPYNANSGSRDATGNIYLRTSIAAGKNMLFRHDDVSGTNASNFGSDGGVHNFLRLLEDWGSRTSYFQGSLVSLYYSQYATGVFKNTGDYSVYLQPGTRNAIFDSNLSQASGLPPGTPRFVDIANLGYFQDLNAGN